MRKKILLVDDSKTFLMYAGLLLKRMNYTVINAASGIEALRILNDMTPDLVMSDLHMETIDGLKLLKHIRTKEQTSKVPVVMASIESGTSVIEQCKSSGCCDYLVKPINIHQLYEVINKCLFQQEGYYRKSIRVPFRKPVIISYNRVQHELHSENISESGIYIKTKTPFITGSEVILTIALEDNVEVTLAGIVVYNNKATNGQISQPPGMAIEFTELTEENSLSLRIFIEHTLAADIFDNLEGNTLSN